MFSLQIFKWWRLFCCQKGVWVNLTIFVCAISFAFWQQIWRVTHFLFFSSFVSHFLWLKARPRLCWIRSSFLEYCPLKIVTMMVTVQKEILTLGHIWFAKPRFEHNQIFWWLWYPALGHVNLTLIGIGCCILTLRCWILELNTTKYFGYPASGRGEERRSFDYQAGKYWSGWERNPSELRKLRIITSHNIYCHFRCYQTQPNDLELVLVAALQHWH